MKASTLRRGLNLWPPFLFAGIHVTEIRPLTDPEPLAREIGRIGVNVNQIAHWANANEHITAEQVAELRASFDRIERLLGDLFANKRTAGKDV